MSKAGSTAIQTALLRQEERLNKLDILNPTTGRRRGAHWGLFREIRDAQEPLLFRQLRETSRDFSTTVISCEGFWFLSDEGIERLAQATEDWDVHVLLFLRRPGGFLGSSYRQHIKSGKVKTSPREFAAGVIPRLAYDDLIRRWSSVFPLVVRVYDVVRNEIEDEFLTLIGAPDLKAERVIANGTPSDGATRVMLLANRFTSKRSRRLRLNKVILSAEAYLSWLPRIDDTPFRYAGRQAASNWDRDVLLRFLDSSDVDRLTCA